MGLSRRFGFSRSPIREALIRLAGDGLVVNLPNRTTIVAPVDIARFPQYVDALDLAQRINTRLAAELRSEADIRDIEAAQKGFIAAVQSRDHLAMSEANKDFHMAIARAGRNPYFAAFYEKLLDEGRRILHLHFDYIEKTNDGRLLTDEHEEMIDAIRAPRRAPAPTAWRTITRASSATASSISCAPTTPPRSTSRPRRCPPPALRLDASAPSLYLNGYNEYRGRR